MIGVACKLQLGVLSSEQLAAAKVLELVLNEALKQSLCGSLPACASVETRLLTEVSYSRTELPVTPSAGATAVAAATAACKRSRAVHCTDTTDRVGL